MKSNPKTQTLPAFRRVSLALLLVAFAFTAEAAITIPGFFNDHMVLQRDQIVPIWGWGAPGEEVDVAFAGQRLRATTDEFGSWMVKLRPMKANAEGQVLTINGRQIRDVLVGEVWLSSGTNPMTHPVRMCEDSRGEIRAADDPLIRLLKIPNKQSPLPVKNVAADWKVCSSQTVGDFSAVGYFFARNLRRELGVPVGVIASSVNGIPIVPWIPAEGFRDAPALKYAVESIFNGRPSTEVGKKAWETYLEALGPWLEKAKQAMAKGETPTDRPEVPTELWITNIVPTKTFNAMIHPLIPYAIRGVIWGHEEGGRARGFYEKQAALISSWRQFWQQGDFPFYLVQEARSEKPTDKAGAGGAKAEMREHLRKCLELDNTGIVVSLDIVSKGSREQNKQDIGIRMARLALGDAYGQEIVHSGPLYRSLAVERSEMRLSFDHVGSGLMVGRKTGRGAVQEIGEALKGFAIAGVDQKWHWAKAAISADGHTVVLSSDRVREPVAACYAYADNPGDANLYNREGLPASPFRTDTFQP